MSVLSVLPPWARQAARKATPSDYAAEIRELASEEPIGRAHSKYMRDASALEGQAHTLAGWAAADEIALARLGRLVRALQHAWLLYKPQAQTGSGTGWVRLGQAEPLCKFEAQTDSGTGWVRLGQAVPLCKFEAAAQSLVAKTADVAVT